MNRRRTFDQELFAHFVTFSCFRRRRLLDHDHPKRVVLGVLNQQLARLNATCAGFVIMPDHVHAVVWFPETGKLSIFVQEWKRLCSRTIRDWYRKHSAAYAFGQETGERFWQHRYYSFEIHRQEKLREKIEYMHRNPVRAGLVQRTTDWLWSSARHYELGRSVGVPIGWIW
ncbi:MAG: transposase [Planctomycetaceae bacterium]